MRQLAFCIGVNQGKGDDFEHAFDQMNQTSDVALKNDLIASLACSKDSLRHVELFDYFVGENNSDVLGSMINVASRPRGYVTSWAYLKANWDYLYNK